ncbi:MAG: thiamine diphosphokinase [Anaerolineaceae bacterium]|nr:thiamine diphosphokinase [Anaerolineaceae bacterium]
MMKSRAILFTNGEDPGKGSLNIHQEDYLIAVDGGLHHLFARGLLPDLLVGDLDSVDPKDLKKCTSRGVEIIKFPSEKDQTDLELALKEGIKRGCREIMIAFALGGRIDHSLGNLALLSEPSNKEILLRFEDGRTEVLLISSHRPVWATHTNPGDTISLIPWQGDVTGVKTEGLVYSLNSENLYSHQTRGISNLAAGEIASVSIETGSLLFIHHRNNLIERT